MGAPFLARSFAGEVRILISHPVSDFDFLPPLRGLFSSLLLTQRLRAGLHSFAPSELARSCFGLSPICLRLSRVGFSRLPAALVLWDRRLRSLRLRSPEPGEDFVWVLTGVARPARSCRWRRLFGSAPVGRGSWLGGRVRARALPDARARRVPRATVAAGWLRCKAYPVPVLARRLRSRHHPQTVWGRAPSPVQRAKRVVLKPARRTLEFRAPDWTRRTWCGAHSLPRCEVAQDQFGALHIDGVALQAVDDFHQRGLDCLFALDQRNGMQARA